MITLSMPAFAFSTRHEQTKPLAIAISLALLFFFYSQYLLTHGHFHEDAYILFIYVENLVNGHGITYYPAGSPIEGATDFVWLILLAALGKTGIDAGTAALALNSVGVFIVSYIIANTLYSSSLDKGRPRLLLLPLTFIWLLQPAVLAAIGGFSVFLYMALVLMAIVCLCQPNLLRYLPYVVITLALFRPDGVIIGIAFSLIGLLQAHHHQQLKSYLRGLSITFAIGLCYFAWRYHTFENLLPLPLYVKSHSAPFAGLIANLSWVKNHLHLILPALLLALLNRRVKDYLVIAFPALLLYLMLTTAEQSQNVGFRFQAPLLISLYFVLVIAAIDYLRKVAITRTIALSFALTTLGLLALGAQTLSQASNRITEFKYINQFPEALHQRLPKESHIVLTEAGRLAYWTQAEGRVITDLVGLNTVFPAKNTITSEYIESLDPDLLMFHHAKMLQSSALDDNSGSNVIHLTDPSKLVLTASVEKREGEKVSKVITASLISIQFINEHFENYDIYLVDYGLDQRYSHVYAIKKELGISDDLKRALERSFLPESHQSYYAMLHRLKNAR